MTNLLFLIPLTAIFLFLIVVRNEILFLKSEITKNKEEILRLEEMMSTPNALKQSESIDSKKKWESMRQAFSNVPLTDKDRWYLSDRN